MLKYIALLFVIVLVTRVQAAPAPVTPLALKCLWTAYPVFTISSDQKFLFFQDGRTLPYAHDSSDTNFDPENPTLIDQMFFQAYPKGFFRDPAGKLTYTIPKVGEDAGRTRFQELFFSLYGDSAAAVSRQLVPVTWIDGSSLSFSSLHGAAAALQAVSDELRVLIQKYPALRVYVQPPLGGTYQWRTIAGSTNLSVHSFGVAIDISVEYSDYWQWDSGKIQYKNRIPAEIARAFERHGFIWGGKWHHYDTMHFEYRPELLLKADVCNSEFRKYPH